VRAVKQKEEEEEKEQEEEDDDVSQLDRERLQK
jgi:hypothetical protein